MLYRSVKDIAIKTIQSAIQSNKISTAIAIIIKIIIITMIRIKIKRHKIENKGRGN